jgi:hypothetical protein
MMLAALLGAAALAPGFTIQAPESEIFVKVVRVDRARREVEVALTAPPKETRIVFDGDPKGLTAGDYVKMRLFSSAAGGANAKVGGAELRSRLVVWKF